MQSDTSDVSLNIAAWYLLVAAVWSFLIEVVALTFGPAWCCRWAAHGSCSSAARSARRPPRSPRMRRHAERTLVASRHRSPRPPATQARSSPSADSLAPAPERRPHPQLAPRFRAFPFRAFRFPVLRFPVLRFRGFPLPAPTPRLQAQGGAPTVQVPAGAPAAPAAAPVRPRSGGCSRRPDCSQGHDPAAEEAGHHHQRHRRRACPARYRLRSGQLHHVQRR